MSYSGTFRANTNLIAMLGESNAHLVWVLGLYLEEPDLEALASEALTDGPNDKKLDFVYLDRDAGRILFAQGYYSSQVRDSAPANKASDLNTAAAWLISGDVDVVPPNLRAVVEECRESLDEGEIQAIELLYVHNLPESVNVARELATAATHLRTSIGDGSGIVVSAREFGNGQIEHLFATQESHIEIKDELDCPARVAFEEKGPYWSASILTVPGSWLHGLFVKYGDSLFSANYRGFLGITKRRRVNTGIRTTAESKPKDFWVFNNGITLLTSAVQKERDGIKLSGISIINGAQTTGSIGAVDLARHDLRDVRVLCRVIQCSDPDTIGDIVRFNNTQNEIMTWDQYSNDPDQIRLEKEFAELHYTYSKKRGFRLKTDQIGIEEVAQPLVAFHGRFQDANSGKSRIFDRKPLYNLAFPNRKARHILLVYTLARAVDEQRIRLKGKSTAGAIISIEEHQLYLLRNLRFKYFFIAVVAECLETIVGRKVDKETIAFSSEAADADRNSLIVLTAKWLPIVEDLLSLLTTEVSAENLGERLAEDNVVAIVGKRVSALLYTTRQGKPSYEEIASMLTAS